MSSRIMRSLGTRRARDVATLFATLATLTTVSLEAQGSPEADVREIRRLRAASNAAIARHDTAGVAAIFAPHVVVTTSNSMQILGRDTNALRFAEQFSSRPGIVYVRTPSEVKVFAPWRMASEYGRWSGEWTGVDGPVTIGGSYFAKWRVIDGAWRVESETFVPERCDGGVYCRTVP